MSFSFKSDCCQPIRYPNQTHSWSTDKLEGIRYKCANSDRLSECVLAICTRDRYCRHDPRGAPIQTKVSHLVNCNNRHRTDHEISWKKKWIITWVLHFHGSNWVIWVMGVGFCIHWMASQLLTIQTSGWRTISSRKRWMLGKILQ